MSSVFDDLIEVVKAHPIIYDIHMKGYQKRGSRREKAWQAVAKCMQQRGHDITDHGCRRRWNKLKFAYTRDRTLRRIQGTPPLRSSCAKYFDSLAFLNPFLDDYKARPRTVQPIVLDSESDDDSAIHSTVLESESEDDHSPNNRSHLLAMKAAEDQSVDDKCDE
uniref:MADF domain-containing protein n=1 Tax=Setaria digitata TaxID=48799 RepID=A0A915PJ66_9BILA